MKKSKPYNVQEETKSVVGEPVTEYYSASVESVEYLSDEILIGAAKYNQVARESGRMISNKEVHTILAERLGWK